MVEHWHRRGADLQDSIEAAVAVENIETVLVAVDNIDNVLLVVGNTEAVLPAVDNTDIAVDTAVVGVPAAPSDTED